MRYCGKICFYTEVEVEPGIWEKDKVIKTYYGDANKLSQSYINQESTNNALRLNCELSVVADPFAYNNFSKIIYAEYMGTKWVISNITVQKPRILLQLGGEYKEDANVEPEDTD